MHTNKEYINPYPGIRSFNFDEAHLFFGREKRISDLVKILKNNCFVAITGASGSGKSSLVKAGLLPALSKDADRFYETFRPGSEPLSNLAESVYKLLYAFRNNNSDELSKAKIFSQISNDPKTFVKQNFEENSGKFLLYIDQFEEMFHDKTNSTETRRRDSDRFIAAILALLETETQNFCVIISLRTDFFGRLL